MGEKELREESGRNDDRGMNRKSEKKELNGEKATMDGRRARDRREKI